MLVLSFGLGASHARQCARNTGGLAQCRAVFRTTAGTNLFYSRVLLWLGRIECGRVLTVTTFPVWLNYLNIVVICCFGSDEVWHFAALECVAIALVCLLLVSEQVVLGFSCYELQMGQGG